MHTASMTAVDNAPCGMFRGCEIPEVQEAECALGAVDAVTAPTRGVKVSSSTAKKRVLRADIATSARTRAAREVKT